MDHIKFYHNKFLNSVYTKGLNASEVGAYALLLFNSIDQKNPGFLPDDMELIRKITRLTNRQWKKSKTKLLKKFNYSDKGYCNDTLLNEIGRAKQISEKRSLASKNRKSKNKVATPIEKRPQKMIATQQVLEMHKLQVYIDKHFVNIKKIENQLTYKQCVMLFERFSEELIISKLKKMENMKAIHLKYQTVFITLEEWCNKEVTGKKTNR